MKIRRALLSVSDKEGLIPLAEALIQSGAELIASGGTAQLIQASGLPVTPIEKVTGNPEAFQGRMKTLSFQVCSAILYQRGDANDEAEARKLGIQPIDCVVVNFYPFEKSPGIEQIDIGGPTLVRAAAKNVPEVLVLTDPQQYPDVIAELQKSGEITKELADRCARRAWERVLNYDQAIALYQGEKRHIPLRYGENPHQSGALWVSPDSPVDWSHPVTAQALSYNNILDFTSAYDLVSELMDLFPGQEVVVVIKHNSPCGVAVGRNQYDALEAAWQGDPVSAFGGVLAFSHPLSSASAEFLSSRFIELLGAPQLNAESDAMKILTRARKKLKALQVFRYGQTAKEGHVAVPGGQLWQTADYQGSTGKVQREELRPVTQRVFPQDSEGLIRFGISVARVLKSNTIALVRKVKDIYQLVGAGQGQPNRVEALKVLAVPRALKVLSETGGEMQDLVMISDAFFPFRDTVDEAYAAGIRWIVQPGGSLRDQDSIRACDELGMGMIMTGMRHFRH